MKQILRMYPHKKRYPDLFRCSFMLLMLLASVVNAQDANTIKGKVNDEGAQLLPGVNVVVKGTTLGTTTDAEGKYR
jgi:hypothetical protein